MKFPVGTSLAFLLLVSCGEKVAPPKIEALRFPVAMLFESSSVRLCHDAAELTNMHTNYLTLNHEPPVLIDAEFKIYSLDNFRSVHGGLWLMANPSATTEVTFALKAQKSGRELARALFARQLEKQTWRDDVEARGRMLASKQTLVEMAEVVQREASP